MRPHRRERVAAARPLLDVQTGERIGVVARPNLAHVAEHAEVEAVAAACARLKEDVREGLGELLQEVVEAEDVAVEELAVVLHLGVG